MHWPHRSPLAALRSRTIRTRPIRLIVPYAPGGGADAVARIIAKLAGDSMGQSIVVENKGGAGSIVGTDLVAKSNPDGYTLLLGQSGPISINPAVYKSLPYDPVKELTPVTMTNSYPYVLVINPKLGVVDAQGLRGARQGAVRRLQLRHHRRRRRQSPDERAVLRQGGRAHDPHPLSRHGARGRRLRLGPGDDGVRRSGQRAAAHQRGHLAGASPFRARSDRRSRRPSPPWPRAAIPMSKQWRGTAFSMPARTPQDIVDKLNVEIVKALANPEIKDLLSKQAMSPVGSTQARVCRLPQEGHRDLEGRRRAGEESASNRNYRPCAEHLRRALPIVHASRFYLAPGIVVVPVGGASERRRDPCPASGDCRTRRRRLGTPSRSRVAVAPACWRRLS